jgi:hypothetical protein
VSLSTNFPTIRPSLSLDFAKSRTVDPRITFTRASTATYFDEDGVLQSAAADRPRIDFNPSTLVCNGLLIEEQRTNSIRNNTMQGAVAGTPGTAATNWNTTNIGLTREIVGTGTENGITYIDIRFSGTATSQFGNVQFETSTGAAASASQSWTASSYLKLVSGSLSSNISAVGLATYYYDSGGVFLSTSSNTLTVGSSFSRYSLSVTTPASTGYIRSGFYFNAASASGSVIDFTLRIGLPQLEQGAFATSVIPTTTTALTRNADVASMTGTNFSSWFNLPSGTVVVEWQLPVNSSDLNALFTIDGNAALPTMAIRMGFNSGRRIRAYAQDSGGVFEYAVDAPVNAAGTTGKSAFAYRSTNDFAVCDGAGTVVSDTSGSIADQTFTTAFIGRNAGTYVNGTIRRIAYYPARLVNAQLQALTL